MKHFKSSEFDSPDEVGSGKRMDGDFLRMLDDAREIAGIAFRVTSGMRTRKYNEQLRRRGYQASKDSSHMKGCAADIAAVNSEARLRIVGAMLAAGFTRIGIGKTFVHCDTDHDKRDAVMWVYDV